MGKWGVVGPSTCRETRRNQLQGSRRETNTWLGVLPLTWDMYHWGMSDITKGCFLELCVLARTFWKEPAEERDGLLSGLGFFFFFAVFSDNMLLTYYCSDNVQQSHLLIFGYCFAVEKMKTAGPHSVFMMFGWTWTSQPSQTKAEKKSLKLLCSRLLSAHL